MSSGRVIVPLRAGSDGDATHRPTDPAYIQSSPPTHYLETLGVLWMKSRGEKLPGVSYALERLPAGYAVFGRPRSNSNGTATAGRMDYYLYGHPGHRKFDSPNRFFPHFQHLMENGGSSFGCTCTVCVGKGGVLPSSSAPSSVKDGPTSRPHGPNLSAFQFKGSSGVSAKTSQPRGRPKTVTVAPGMDTSRVDEEGTPDVYRQLIDKLKKANTLDVPITEPLSLDWQAEQEILPKLKQELKQGQQFLPRVGEIVLFVRVLPKDVSIVREPKSGHFRLYDEVQGNFLGYPKWEASMVGQTPVEKTEIDDLVVEANKVWNISYTGVRVEPLPNINSKDKSLSKQYKYVPLHQTRPFVFWQEFLSHLRDEEFHPTIRNALTAMATMSLVDKHRFRSTWPQAWIYCSAIFLGSELLAVGDTVRLLPKTGQETCTDVLHITSIRLKFTNLDLASENDYDEGRPYNSEVFIFGKGYTTEQSYSSKQWLSIEDSPPDITTGYTATHPLHPPKKEMMIPFSRVLGRLYHADALTLWLGDNTVQPSTFLSAGKEGLLSARRYARENDHRIAESFGINWFWADNRAEALDLQTINGLEVSKYDTERESKKFKDELKEWRLQVKIAEDKEKEQERAQQKIAFQGQKSLRGFMAPGTQQPQHQQRDLSIHGASSDAGPVHQRGGVGMSRTASGTSTTMSLDSTAMKRASKVIELSSDEEEEIRRQSRLVSDADELEKKMKKAKVAVGVVIKP